MGRKRITRFALVASLVSAIACSSGSGTAPSSTGPGGSFDCNSFCGQVAAAHCPNDDPSTCASQCQQQLSQFSGKCSNELGNAIACIVQKLPLACDPSSGQAFPGGDPQSFQTALLQDCPTESQAVAACSACEVSANSSASEVCLKTKCCAELQALVADPNSLAASSCIQQCNGDPTCTTNCTNQYASLEQKAQAEANCVKNNCP